MEAESRGRGGDPLGRAEGPAPSNAPRQGLLFLVALRLVDPLHPIARPRGRRVAEQDALPGVAPAAPLEAAPSPLFRPGDQPGPQGVALHVSQDRPE